ncbi:hypothetical protein ABZ389_26885, partial [Streptomyces sp. NPDC005877]
MDGAEDLYEIPLIRAGLPRQSAERAELAGVDGTPLALVHLAPPLLARLTVADARAGARHQGRHIARGDGGPVRQPGLDPVA